MSFFTQTNLLIVPCSFPVPAALMESTNLFTHWCWIFKKNAQKTAAIRAKCFSNPHAREYMHGLQKKNALPPETRIMHVILFPKFFCFQWILFGGQIFCNSIQN